MKAQRKPPPAATDTPAARNGGARQASSRWQELIPLAAILLLATLLRLHFLEVPLERDEGEYATMGQLLLRGGVPYVDAANMKLPGTYYAYAAILAVLGSSAEAVRLGLLFLNLVSIVLVQRIGR